MSAPSSYLLMAAAPKLYEALRDATDQSQHADGCIWWDTPAVDLAEGAHGDCNCWIKAARYALALVDA